MPRLIVCLAAVLLAALPAKAHQPMTPARMVEIVLALDPDAEVAGTFIQLDVAEIPILIVFHPEADRMRAITPIRSVEGLASETIFRLMQANFDTALDARYAVANGKLWAAFIHPLSALDKRTLISGVGQVANLALSYGSTYSSGALGFGGGDSRQIIENLMKKGRPI